MKRPISTSKFRCIHAQLNLKTIRSDCSFLTEWITVKGPQSSVSCVFIFLGGFPAPSHLDSGNRASVMGLQSRPRWGGKTPNVVRQSGARQCNGQGAVKGVYLKGLFAQSRLFKREMDCPVLFYRGMDCPVRWSLATPSALESQNRAQELQIPFASADATKAGHLQVRVAVGRWSTCVLKEAPLNQCAPKERRRGRAEKRLSKRVFLESPFLLCSLKICS